MPYFSTGHLLVCDGKRAKFGGISSVWCVLGIMRGHWMERDARLHVPRRNSIESAVFTVLFINNAFI